jgi:glycosyltransferase involved in cell wall biosynthesis
VSVIIPAYNRANIVRETVDSVLCQTYADFEVIVVDDGSTDNTREVMATYVDPRVRYFYKTNGGLSSARNFGLSEATGEYIAFLDSDDVWRPWKLSAQVEIFRRHADVGMIWSDMSSFADDGTILEERHIRNYYSVYRAVDLGAMMRRVGTVADLGVDAPTDIATCPYHIGDIFDAMFIGNLVHPPTAIVRRSRLQGSGPFQPEITGAGAEDYHFYFRIAELGPVSFLDAPSILYRVHPAQMSNHGLREARGNLNVVLHWMKAHPPRLPAAVIRSRLASSHGWLGMEELRAGNTRAATPHLFKSLRYQFRQPLAAAFLMVSLLPPGSFGRLRTMRRAMKRMTLRPLVALTLLLTSEPELFDQVFGCVRRAFCDA